MIAKSHPRVAVALSGGVDSAMAAALLIEQGYDVFGITMRIWQELPEAGQPTLPDVAKQARQVADALHIPLHVVDAAVPFKTHVVDPFIAAYSGGRTPNPCLYCNRHVKFGYLLRQALDLGADTFATGHYTRIRRNPNGQDWQLLRGSDPAKDQSYMLYMLGQQKLGKIIFPLGELDKTRVRQMARERRLPAAHAEESQDLCFVLDNDYRRFLARYAPKSMAPGPILNSHGQEIGRHKGLAAYTIGQRGGLGIAAPEALYVLRIDTAHNALIVGPRRELGHDSLLAADVRWVSGYPPTSPVAVTAQIRYKAPAAPATVTPLPEARARVHFDHPLRDITPGQGVVFYDQEIVLGGGLIQE